MLEVDFDSGNEVDQEPDLVANEYFDFEINLISLKNLEFVNIANEAGEQTINKNLNLSSVAIDFILSDTSTEIDSLADLRALMTLHIQIQSSLRTRLSLMWKVLYLRCLLIKPTKNPYRPRL